jgi:hypothetical protein
MPSKNSKHETSPSEFPVSLEWKILAVEPTPIKSRYAADRLPSSAVTASTGFIERRVLTGSLAVKIILAKKREAGKQKPD